MIIWVVARQEGKFHSYFQAEKMQKFYSTHLVNKQILKQID